jgi:flagellar assembly factor FliW
MKTATTIEEAETLEVKGENIVQLPFGLLGFEGHKRFVLLSQADEVPFSWLQMLEEPHQAFLVVPPSVAIADYQPEIATDDVEFLNLQAPGDALVYNIVTLRHGGGATVNLKGPIIINRRTLVGKQVIPLNASRFPVQHPLSPA